MSKLNWMKRERESTSVLHQVAHGGAQLVGHGRFGSAIQRRVGVLLGADGRFQLLARAAAPRAAAHQRRFRQTETVQQRPLARVQHQHHFTVHIVHADLISKFSSIFFIVGGWRRLKLTWVTDRPSRGMLMWMGPAWTSTFRRVRPRGIINSAVTSPLRRNVPNPVSVPRIRIGVLAPAPTPFR